MASERRCVVVEFKLLVLVPCGLMVGTGGPTHRSLIYLLDFIN